MSAHYVTMTHMISVSSIDLPSDIWRRSFLLSGTNGADGAGADGNPRALHGSARVPRVPVRASWALPHLGHPQGVSRAGKKHKWVNCQDTTSMSVCLVFTSHTQEASSAGCMEVLISLSKMLAR